MYVTKAEFRGAGTMPMVQQATTAAIPDDQLDDLIEMASRLFDLLCGVAPEYFEPAGATATARTFYGAPETTKVTRSPGTSWASFHLSVESTVIGCR